MKKVTILLIAFLSLSLFTKGHENDIQAEENITVYITKSGTKYHSKSCNYLKGNGIPKKLSEVKGKYEPCSRCNPLKTNVASEENKKSNNTKNITTEEKTSTGKTIHTGPRGGKYYINKNGNKTYIKK